MRLPTIDSSTGRAIKVFIFALLGFFSGLILAVWNVPGVPEVVKTYLSNNLPTVLVTIGLPAALSSGVIAFVFNWFRKDVKNY